MTIVAIPTAVCPTHAIEFWTGLLAYARERSAPCLCEMAVCECPRCDELTASQLRAFAIASVGPSPGDHVAFPIRLAS